MKYSLLLIACLCIHVSVSAQSRPQCITTEMDVLKRAQYPESGTLDDFERALQQQITLRQQHIQGRMLLTLPTIVHIIHEGEDIGIGSNISHAQVLSQFDVLNEDFRKKSGTPGFNNDPVGADIELEFCPATLDPDDNPLFEWGVHRINRRDMGWDAGPYSANFIDNTVKPATFWDPDKYLNIWVIAIAGDILGFADFPIMSGLSGMPNFNTPANRDGIVVGTTFFGRTGNVKFPYDQGRTATHEIGHWLGVFHPQGRDNGGCSQDDFCTDTPNSDSENFGCDVGHESCGSDDMVRNYMDRSDDACMNIFTQCQKTRMRTVLDNSPRRGILASANTCTMDLPPAVAFRSNSSIVCAGQSIRFTDASANGPVSWNWSFPGATPSSSSDPNPQVRYTTEGTYTVTLEATNSFGTRSLTQTDFIVVNSSEPSVIFEEKFENGIPADWTIDNPDEAITWESKKVGGSQAGENTAFVQLYFYAATGARDGLISPVIDLSGVTNTKLRFDHVYRQEIGSEKDSLIVYASTDGGNSFPHVLIRMGENGDLNFATGAATGSNPGPYAPTEDDDWCGSGDGAACVELDLEPYSGIETFALRFETVSDFGNNIYLDNIEIEGTCNIIGVEPKLADTHSLQIYPNPSQGIFQVELDHLLGQEVELTVYNLGGQEIWGKSLGKRVGFVADKVEWENPQAGAYFLRVGIGEDVVFKKILIQN